jgi:hypothetical protein
MGHEMNGPVDHLPGHQGPAGVFQKHPLAVERRELAAAKRDVEGRIKAHGPSIPVIRANHFLIFAHTLSWPPPRQHTPRV